MREIASLAALPHAACRAVIINCGTKWVSALALVSVLRNTDCPVLVVDCESTDGSRATFERLAADYALAFDWLEWPLRSHAATLDRLFAGIDAERVLLVDSDCEVRARRVYEAMRDTLDAKPLAYGAGFLQGPAWLGRERGWPERAGFYPQRMWIPFVLVRAAVVRDALSAHPDQGFADLRNLPERERWPRWLARLLIARHRLPGWRRRSSSGRPLFIEWDTGARLHRDLVERGHPFEEIAPELWTDVHHRHGVTRAALLSGARGLIKRWGLIPSHTETTQEAVLAEVRARLEEVYGVRTFEG